MPSQTFQLSRPDGGLAVQDPLPQYTRDSKLPSYLQPQDNVSVMGSSITYDEKHAPAIVYDYDETREESSARVPQALLVDAAASLCGYLYFVG